MSGRSSIGQMKAFHSNSRRSFHRSRSSSARSSRPSRLQRTSCCGGATVEMGSIWRKPRRRIVSRTPRADPSRSCARIAILRASSRVTSSDLTQFVLSQLPPTSARVLEVGCGAGDLARDLSAEGYHVLAIDPDAPEGPIFRRTTIEVLDDPGPFDAVVASLSLHHVEDLGGVLDKLVRLLEGPLILNEHAWDRLE